MAICWIIRRSSPDYLARLPPLTALSRPLPMSKRAAIRQFETVIKADLNRWLAESDLTVEDLARAAFVAIDEWLDEGIMEFEPEDED